MKQEEKNINFSEELAKIKEDLKEQKFLIEAVSTINSCKEESLKLIKILTYILNKNVNSKSKLIYFRDIDDSYELYKNTLLVNEISKKLASTFNKKSSEAFKPLIKINESYLKKIYINITILDDHSLKKLNKVTVAKKLEYNDKDKVHLACYNTYYYLKKDGKQDKVI